MSQAVDAFWAAVDDELARYPMRAELEPLPQRSTESSISYGVRLTSIGPYRISGFYSVPVAAESHPVPGLLITPRYGSVNNPPHFDDRERYAVLQLNHRGQRLADKPFAATYPGLLTLGIDSPATYIYRGIVADCLRAAEFLLSRPELDAAHVGIHGDDLALLTAARRPGFTAVVASELLLYRLMDASARTDAYPVEELNDYLRSDPESRDRVARTLAHFDPIEHVATIRSAIMLTAEADDAVGGEAWLRPLRTACATSPDSVTPTVTVSDVARGTERQVAGKAACDIYRLTHHGAVDHDWLDAWLAGKLGAPPRSRFLERVSL